MTRAARTTAPEHRPAPPPAPPRLAPPQRQPSRREADRNEAMRQSLLLERLAEDNAAMERMLSRAEGLARYVMRHARGEEMRQRAEGWMTEMEAAGLLGRQR